jgi:multiple antibiotic resistance protein
MSGAMLLMANASGHVLNQIAVIVALLTVMAFTLILLLGAQEIRDWIGMTAQKVVMRVFGILLSAIAVQSVFNGISGSGIFLRSL